MFIVGVAGGSGSGKTTFSKKILKNVASSEVTLIHLDSYYLDEMPQSLYFRGKPNFDHPGCFDWDRLTADLSALRAGQRVELPVYDFERSRRSSDVEVAGPCKAVIFEGIYALWNDEVRALMDLKVFINVDADIRIIRRLHRDLAERGRTLESVIDQYYGTVRPMYRAHLAPTQQHADLIVGEENGEAAAVVASHIRSQLLV